MKLIFDEVLNDFYSCFLLGDIVTLKKYQYQKQLPNDLATEFTTQSTGDDVVYQGVMIPLNDIENLPYKIIFNTKLADSELQKSKNKLQISQDGYILKVTSGYIRLFTWRLLKDFSDEKITNYLNLAEQLNHPKIQLENGFYKVMILGGMTDIDTPTFEFIFEKTNQDCYFTGNSSQSFSLALS